MIRSMKLGTLMVAVVALFGAGMAALAAGTAPVLQSTSPTSGASVQSAPTVSSTYDQALHPSSTLVVRDSTDVAVAGTTSFSADAASVVFTPASVLTPAGNPYAATATVRNATDDQQVISAWSFSIDTTAPSPPTITSVDGDSSTPATGSDPSPTIVVSGVVAGDTVRVLVDATERSSAVVPAGDTTMTFNVDPDTDIILASDGEHRLTATSADPAGNVSPASTAFLYVLDTTAPAAPTITSVNGDATSPASGNDPTPRIVVSGVVAGDTVRILEGTTVKATKVVPAPAVPGSASVTFNPLAASSEVTLAGDGPYTLTAEAVDAAENVSPASSGFVYTLETGAPAPPTIASVDGVVSTPAVGNDPTPVIMVSGVIAGDTVRVFDGATLKATKVVPAAATSVSFNVGPADADVLLATDGDHSLTAISTDPQGNASTASDSFVYTLDTGIAPPALVSTFPASGSTGQPPATVSATYTERLDRGLSTLSVTNGPGNSIAGTVAFSADAKTITFTPSSTLSEAGSGYTAQAVVRDGNGNTTTSTWSFTVDSTGPAAPTITSVDARTNSPAAGTDASPTIVVSGVEAGHTVRILDGATVRGTKIVAVGATSVTFNTSPADTEVVLPDDGSHSLTATATDASGNPSAASPPFVYALTTSFPGEFHGLIPARILDTRAGTGGFNAPVGPGATIAVPVAGQGGVPATGASAVVLNVTITEPTAETFLTVYPSGTTRPLASNLNALANKTVPNLVVAKVGADGKVSVYNNTGTSHVIYDVMGWFSDSTGAAGARFSSLTPARLVDTRAGTGGFSAPVGAAATISPTVIGVGGVPASGVSAVVLNVTVTQPTAESFLTVFPTGAARPLASNLNFVARRTVPNLVIAKVGAEGKVSVYNHVGTTDVILDVVGWFGAVGADAGDRFNSLSPSRILDTRSGTGGFSAPIAAGGTISPAVTGVGGVPASGVSAVVLNVTVTEPTATEGFLTVFPSNAARPLASNLNFVAGQTVPNLVMAKVGADGKVSVFNNQGTSHIVFDVVGWYSG
jgi:hypothetical protein